MFCFLDQRQSKLLVILLACLLSVSHEQSFKLRNGNNYNKNGGMNSNHHSSKVKHPSFLRDSRSYRHGSKVNEEVGGTCREFLAINSLNSCCASRDDDCYMIHYDTVSSSFIIIEVCV
jgi:hypothetical protein